MIRESGGVRVVLFDAEIRFVIEQPVEHERGIPHGRADELDT